MQVNCNKILQYEITFISQKMKTNNNISNNNNNKARLRAIKLTGVFLAFDGSLDYSIRVDIFETEMFV